MIEAIGKISLGANTAHHRQHANAFYRKNRRSLRFFYNMSFRACMQHFIGRKILHMFGYNWNFFMQLP